MPPGRHSSQVGKNHGQHSSQVEQSSPPRSTWVPSCPSSRGAAPLALGEVLVGAQQFVAQQSGSAMTQDQWRRIVGERIAKNSRVGRLRNGILQVKVASSSWCSELGFLKNDLILRLQRSGHDVRDLSLRVDGAVRTSKPKRWADKAVPSAELPPDEEVSLPPELEARLDLVEDQNLRAAIAEAALYSLKAQKKRG